MLSENHLMVGGEAVADPGFGKKGFMRMCTVATTPLFDAHVNIDAMKVAATAEKL